MITDVLTVYEWQRAERPESQRDWTSGSPLPHGGVVSQRSNPSGFQVFQPFAIHTQLRHR